MEEGSGSSVESIKPTTLEHDIENQVENTDQNEGLNSEVEEGLNEEEILTTDEEVKDKLKTNEHTPLVDSETTKSLSWKSNYNPRPISRRNSLEIAQSLYSDGIQCNNCSYLNESTSIECKRCKTLLIKNDSKNDIDQIDIYTHPDFNKLKTDFNKYSKDGKISSNDLDRLIDTRRAEQDFFLNEYLRNTQLQGNDGYTFIDYYTIIQHLQNLKNIKAKELLKITEDIVQQSVERKKLEMTIGETF